MHAGQRKQGGRWSTPAHSTPALFGMVVVKSASGSAGSNSLPAQGAHLETLSLPLLTQAPSRARKRVRPRELQAVLQQEVLWL